MNRFAVPRVLPPSENVTDPVAPDGETVAVSVTVCPEVEGLGEAERPVLLAFLAGLLTVWLTAVDALPL